MSRTKRTPIARQPALQISPRAIELFEAMEQAKRRRNIADCIDDDSGSGSGYCKLECAHCNEWHRLHAELHDELHLKPWEWPVMGLNPFAPGSERSKRWRPDPHGAGMAQWRLLDAARKAARATNKAYPKGRDGGLRAVGQVRSSARDGDGR
jgi:hypothetical protein